MNLVATNLVTLPATMEAKSIMCPLLVLFFAYVQLLLKLLAQLERAFLAFFCWFWHAFCHCYKKMRVAYPFRPPYALRIPIWPPHHRWWSLLSGTVICQLLLLKLFVLVVYSTSTSMFISKIFGTLNSPKKLFFLKLENILNIYPSSFWWV